tara:strand:+ start:294 stop:803 length:510 start_codon:yes stop_codon:yes gene_type:complete
MGGALYAYTPVIQSVIHGMKYDGNFKLGNLIQRAIQFSDIPHLYFETDGHVCVPSHWFRQFFRGRQHIPFLFDIFKGQNLDFSSLCHRRRYSRASVGLTRKERLQSISQRFKWRGNSSIQSVTILDDVCTTGATLSAMAKLLKSNGIENVYALVIAHQPLDKSCKNRST